MNNNSGRTPKADELGAAVNAHTPGPPPMPGDPAQTPNQQLATGPASAQFLEWEQRYRESEAHQAELARVVALRQQRRDHDRLHVVWPAFETWQAAIEERPALSLAVAPRLSALAVAVAMGVFALTTAGNRTLGETLQRTAAYVVLGGALGYLAGVGIRELLQAVGGTDPANPNLG